MLNMLCLCQRGRKIFAKPGDTACVSPTEQLELLSSLDVQLAKGSSNTILLGGMGLKNFKRVLAHQKKEVEEACKSASLAQKATAALAKGAAALDAIWSSEEPLVYLASRATKLPTRCCTSCKIQEMCSNSLCKWLV